MYKKKIKSWIDRKDSYGTYHGDGEYVIAASDVEDFCEYIEKTFPDLIGIPCLVGKGGIWFFDDDLERVESY